MIPTTPASSAAAMRTARSLLMKMKKIPMNIPTMDTAIVAEKSNFASCAVTPPVIPDPLSLTICTCFVHPLHKILRL